MKTNEFISKWDELRKQKGYMQRLDPQHPLDFFIGINESGYDQLALITFTEPAQMKSSKALEVEKNKRKDGKWATQISSVEKSNQDIFARLCVDLVENSYISKSEQEGISRVTARFLAWQKLFSRMQDTLPKSVLKGLVGELIFAKYLIGKSISKDNVMNAWMGPNGADRDFVLDDQWYEIKAIATGKDRVTISSLNQLETNLKGHLVITYIDDSSKTDIHAFSVAGLVAEFRDVLNDAPEANRIFEEKLVSVGYLDKSAYEEIYFTVGNTDYYYINDTFPRLVTETVPTEIVGVKYDLSIVGIESWKVGEDNLWN
ncbi:MAG TPA: PD-(D/E)XK motif protein [Lachnospiraceae bacterium]|nr:PD-(D/E)XK motif protein [Lachnospiraceae bacterium]